MITLSDYEVDDHSTEGSDSLSQDGHALDSPLAEVGAVSTFQEQDNLALDGMETDNFGAKKDSQRVYASHVREIIALFVAHGAKIDSNGEVDLSGLGSAQLGLLKQRLMMLSKSSLLHVPTFRGPNLTVADTFHVFRVNRMNRKTAGVKFSLEVGFLDPETMLAVGPNTIQRVASKRWPDWKVTLLEKEVRENKIRLLNPSVIERSVDARNLRAAVLVQLRDLMDQAFHRYSEMMLLKGVQIVTDNNSGATQFSHVQMVRFLQAHAKALMEWRDMNTSQLSYHILELDEVEMDVILLESAHELFETLMDIIMSAHRPVVLALARGLLLKWKESWPTSLVNLIHASRKDAAVDPNADRGNRTDWLLFDREGEEALIREGFQKQIASLRFMLSSKSSGKAASAMDKSGENLMWGDQNWAGGKML